MIGILLAKKAEQAAMLKEKGYNNEQYGKYNWANGMDVRILPAKKVKFKNKVK